MKQTYLLFAALLTLVLPWGQLQAAFLEWDATAGSEQTTYHERELFTDAPWKLLTLQHLFYHNQGTLALLNYSITAGQGEDRVIAAPRQGQAYADYRWGTAKGSWSMFSANSKVTFTAQSPTTLETSGSYQALADPYEGAARVGAALQLEANGSFVEFSREPETRFELTGQRTAGLRHYLHSRIMVGWHHNSPVSTRFYGETVEQDQPDGRSPYTELRGIEYRNLAPEPRQTGLHWSRFGWVLEQSTQGTEAGIQFLLTNQAAWITGDVSHEINHQLRLANYLDAPIQDQGWTTQRQSGGFLDQGIDLTGRINLWTSPLALFWSLNWGAEPLMERRTHFGGNLGVKAVF